LLNELSPQHSTVLSIFKAQEKPSPAATCLATNPFGTVVSPCSSFVHVTEKGELSKALTKQFLPARSSLLDNYLQEACGPACQLGSASSVGDF
jgi:hypothetical protein